MCLCNICRCLPSRHYLKTCGVYVCVSMYVCVIRHVGRGGRCQQINGVCSPGGGIVLLQGAGPQAMPQSSPASTTPTTGPSLGDRTGSIGGASLGGRQRALLQESASTAGGGGGQPRRSRSQGTRKLHKCLSTASYTEEMLTPACGALLLPPGGQTNNHRQQLLTARQYCSFGSTRTDYSATYTYYTLSTLINSVGGRLRRCVDLCEFLKILELRS